MKQQRGQSQSHRLRSDRHSRPTFAVEKRFWAEYDRLSAQERHLFNRARDEFVRVLRDWERGDRHGIPQFPNRLGVKPMVDRPGIMEMAWAGDGRCTWEYGKAQLPGVRHVIWRRIGSHDIYDDP